MARNPIHFEQRSGVARLTLCEGDRGNPFDQALCESLLAISQRCCDEPAIRAVLIRAEGPRFSVGGDLKWLGASRDDFGARIAGSIDKINGALTILASGDMPVVVAIQGIAAGGAIGLAAVADVTLAAPSARFVPAFAAIGFSMDSGGSFFLPRRVGSRRATDFFLLNQTWTADQAAEYGLVSRVVVENQLEHEATAVAEHLAQGPTKAFGEMRRLLLSSGHASLKEQLAAEANALLRCARTEDSWNAIAALLDKRSPQFSGI